MAHELEFAADGTANFAYVGQKAWHGLGHEMQPGATPDDMMRAAKLDWTIEMKDIYTKNAAGEMVLVPSRKVAIRSSDEAQFTVASPKWTPTQNASFFAFAKELADEFNTFVETAGSLRNGKTPFALINLNQDFWVGNERDVVRNYLLLSWSHVVGRANKAKAVNQRVVCANTEAMAIGEDGLVHSQTHSEAFDFDAVRAMFGKAVSSVEGQRADYNKLTTLKLGQFDVVKFLQPLLQPATQEQIEALNIANEDCFQRALWNGTVKMNGAFEDVMDSMQTAPGATPGNEQTGWGVFNALTHWTNHRAGRQADARVTSAWFGERADMVANAKRGLLAMAD